MSQYSHLEDEAIIRHIQTDSNDPIALELADRLENSLDNSDSDDEYATLCGDYDIVRDDLDDTNSQIDEAEKYAKLVIRNNDLLYDFESGRIDETVMFLCDKIHELMNANSNS